MYRCQQQSRGFRYRKCGDGSQQSYRHIILKMIRRFKWNKFAIPTAMHRMMASTPVLHSHTLLVLTVEITENTHLHNDAELEYEK